MVFHIYSATLSKRIIDGTTNKPDSYRIKHYAGVRLVSKRRSNWEEVAKFIEEVVAADRAQGPERLELTGMDRRVYLAAVEARKLVGKPIDLAAIDFAAATQTLAPCKLDSPALLKRGRQRRLFGLHLYFTYRRLCVNCGCND